MSLSDSIKNAIKTKLPSVTIDNSLQEAIEILSTANVSALVVFTGEDLVGIVTEMDMMHGVVENGDLHETKVASIMTACELITDKGTITPCIQLDLDEEVGSALNIMNEAGVHHLLVSGSDGKAAGMVSASDLLRIVIQ